MNKCKVNYWVDMITGVAFLVCAVTGLFRLFPEATVSVSAAGQPVILGVGTSVWRTVHDWSGVVMAAGVGVHTALHLRWLVAMTGRMLRGEGRQTGRRTERRAGLAQAPTTSAAAVAVARGATVHPAAAEAPPAARRVSRRGFLAAAGVVGATAFFAGCGLLSGGDDNASPGTARGRQHRSDEIESERAGASSRSDIRSDDGSSNGGSSPNGGSSSSSTDGGSSTNGGSTTESRVVVDATACTGCGTCAQVCPYGVFTLSDGKAVAQNPEACRLCGRCLRTCAPGAITLNA